MTSKGLPTIGVNSKPLVFITVSQTFFVATETRDKKLSKKASSLNNETKSYQKRHAPHFFFTRCYRSMAHAANKKLL